MSDGLEILRRLLLVLGAVIAAGASLLGIALMVDTNVQADQQMGAAFLVGAIFGFAGWRRIVNWVLLYKAPETPPKSF